MSPGTFIWTQQCLLTALWKHSWLSSGGWSKALMIVPTSLWSVHRCVLFDWVRFVCHPTSYPDVICLMRTCLAHLSMTSVCVVWGHHFIHRCNSTPGCCREPRSSRLDSPQLYSTGQWAGSLGAAGHFCTDSSSGTTWAANDSRFNTFITQQTILCPGVPSPFHHYNPPV